ncbi:DHH phosphoesterase, partial [Ceratobasidium sp. AG-I]
MSALSQFLLKNKQSFLADLSSKQGEGWTIVMGNEAGDLDSCASALAHSYLSTTLDHKPTIALIQTPRVDLYLRPENLLAFQLAHLDLNSADLLTMDDLPSPLSISAPRASFALVDHNTINPNFLVNPETDPTQDARVNAIFDHHKDERNHLSASPPGSCASLIIEYYRARFPPSSSITPQSAWSDAATLLLSAIVIDTNGLKVKEGAKAQPVDHAAAEFLYPISAFGALSAADGTPNPEKQTIPDLTDVLTQRKRAVEKLSGRDLLRRDYKEYNYLTTNSSRVRIGLSTVPLSLDDWLERDKAAKFWADQDAWIKERELTVSGVLCTFRTKKKNKHKREMLLVFSPGASPALEAQLYAGLEGNTDLKVARRE